MNRTKTQSTHEASRRRLLRGCASAGTILALASLPLPGRAAKVAKSDFFYQDHPKDGKSCGACAMYSGDPAGKGTCALVDGEISANGWCLAFSAKR